MTLQGYYHSRKHYKTNQFSILKHLLEYLKDYSSYEYSSIGLVITAKSVVRYKKISEGIPYFQNTIY